MAVKITDVGLEYGAHWEATKCDADWCEMCGRTGFQLGLWATKIICGKCVAVTTWDMDAIHPHREVAPRGCQND